MIGAFVIAAAISWAAWQVWEVVAPKPAAETVAKDQAVMQGQLNYVQSQMDGLKKEVADLKKAVQIYKRAVLEAKGRVLNADQDIHKFVEAALKDEPVQAIKSDADLLERARAVGLKSVVLK
jgi:hypothetical protein